MDKLLQEILEKAKENGYEDSALIEKAYLLARDLCKAKDAIGIEHNAAVGKGLAELGMDPKTIAIGLLHNAPRHGCSIESIRALFGDDVANSIDCLDKFELNTLEKGINIEKKKKLLMSLTKDVRLVLLEIIERLDLLKRMEKISEAEKKALLEEVREIYLPAAEKLGTYSFSSEMQDLLFKNDNRREYDELKEKIDKRASEQKDFVSEITKRLKQKIKEAGISAKVKYRTKGVYATYEKMQRKKKSFDEIMDICGIRVITETIEDCYKILGIVNSLGDTIAEEFDDYIAKPKKNGYQSIHTVIKGNEGKGVEIQIRTKEMDDAAELGIAAHWRYKDIADFGNYDNRFMWMREIFEWQKASGKGIKGISGSRIFALTPKGDPIELPEGATVIDFAYAVHSELGNKCVKAKINGKIAPLDAEVKNGDSVEIITAANQKPKRQWLSFVKTEKAKQKIRSLLHIKEKPKKEKVKKIMVIKSKDSRVKLAKCCNPLPGDEIIAFATTKRKISVHVKGCEEARKLMESKKMIEIDWGEGKESYLTEVSVVAEDRIGLFRDLVGVFSERGINVETVDAKTKKNRAICIFRVSVKSLEHLMGAIEALYRVKGVFNIKRGSI